MAGTPSRSRLAAGLLAMSLALAVATGSAWASDAVEPVSDTALWAAVRGAKTAEAQEEALSTFLATIERSKGRSARWSMSAQVAKTGEKRGFEDRAIMANPAAHILTVVIDRKIYVFRPMSARSVALLLEE